jgi:septal ring factor EnvC (AmiA/AmiB activator)
MTPAEKHQLELKRMDLDYAIDSSRLALKNNAKKAKELEFNLILIREQNQKLEAQIAEKQHELNNIEEQLTQ